jgi:uncharacterized protein (TIGR00369 family)
VNPAAVRLDTDLEPALAARIERLFHVPFLVDLGARLTVARSGLAESVLDVAPRHGQQDGFVHAGVMATLADHTAGAAAGTVLRPDQGVLSIEFKVNLLRPATGSRLRCRAQVLRPGRTVSVVEAEVFSETPGSAEPRLCAKATVTLAVVERPG